MDFPHKTAVIPRKQLQKVTILIYPPEHKKIKQWLRQKKASKAYNFLQNHRPQNTDHKYLYLQIFLKSIIKLIQSELHKSQQPSIMKIQKLASEGYKLLKQLHEQLHCQQSCLKGNIKVKNDLDKHIDEFWISYLDLFMNLAIGYKLNHQWRTALQLLSSADTISNQIVSSSTSNKQILRKVVKVKSLTSSFCTQLSEFKLSVRLLESSLHISLNEIIIRDRERDYSKKDLKHGKKSYFMYQRCKQSILSILIKLMYDYEFLKQYDMIPFLIEIIKSLLFEWKIEKSTGIYKLIEKLDSNECLGYYHDYQAVFVQLTYLLSNIFDIDEIRKNKLERKSRSKPKRKIKMRSMNKVYQEISKAQNQQQLNNGETALNQQQKNSLNSSFKESKLLPSQPSIATISQSKGVEASGQMPCTQELLDFDALEIVKNKRKTLTHKKQDKRQFQERNKKNNINHNISIEELGNEVDGYINAIIQCSSPKQKFQPYKKVENRLRKLSLNIKQQFNNIDYEMYKIRSRSNNSKPLSKFENKYEIANPRTMKFNNPQIDFKSKHTKMNTNAIPKFQFPNTTIVHQLLLKHKQQLDLSRLYTHHLKYYQKAKEKKQKQIKKKQRLKDRESEYERLKDRQIQKQKQNRYLFNNRRSRDAVKYTNPHLIKRVADNCYLKSMQGIEQMKEEIKGKIFTADQAPLFLPSRKVSKKAKDTDLFLTSMNRGDADK